MNEFEIIQHYFKIQNLHRKEVLLGIGDDAAITTLPAGQELVLTIDTLISGVHFFESALAYDIGHKALAVNLSDLAAMGATPAWFLLALTLPSITESWLKEFTSGLFELANQYQMQLVGGNMTKGPLSITIQACGFVPAQKALRRDGAKPGDLIYVTHTCGDAALALDFLNKKTIKMSQHNEDFILSRLHRPSPRVHIGTLLRNRATAAIDLSDGLVADLTHILEQSHVGAVVYVDQIPFSNELLASVSLNAAIELALRGGDDYELCFTIAKENAAHLAFECTCIGEITAQTGLHLQFKAGKEYVLPISGYQHF